MAKLKITITEIHIHVEGTDPKMLPDLFEQAFARIARPRQEPVRERRPARAKPPAKE